MKTELLKKQLEKLDKERHKIQRDIMSIETLNKNKAILKDCIDRPTRYNFKLVVSDKFNSGNGTDLHLPVELSSDFLSATIIWLDSQNK